jgi:hypothetical protein
MQKLKQKRKLSYNEFCALAFGNHFFRYKDGVFATDEDFQVAWLLHRDELITSNPGRRPAAWWQLEAPVGLEKPRASGAETILLFERGLLTKDEIAKLMPQWRVFYEEAQQPDFTFHTGDGWIEGAEARRQHYQWAGIPRAIVAQFDAEREREV